MKEKFEQFLFKEFPFIETKHFYCGDGWFNLIYSLSHLIEQIVKKDNLKDFKVIQVKEKFGCLRYYIENTNKDIFDLTIKASNQSCFICEECGQLGELRQDLGWLKTLCPECYKEFKNKKYKV
jgi:hypothetical protein